MRVYVVGAGLAGLAAALAVSEAGRAVTLFEATPQAGGRCRSFDDPLLERRIDNGSHVLIGANPAALAYLDEIGARDSLVRIGSEGCPFVDIERGDRWSFRAGHALPGAGFWEHLASLRLLLPVGGRTVAQVLGGGLMMQRLWEPLTVAALNTAPRRASAALLQRVMIEVLRRGRRGLDLYMARDGLSESFVNPALNLLAKRGVDVRLGRPLRGLSVLGSRAVSLQLDEEVCPLGPSDRLILAIPPWAVVRLLPDVPVPNGFNAIVNGHFRLDPERTPADDHPIMGVVGGTVQWIFRRGDVLSVTVSDAGALNSIDHLALADRLWGNVETALGCPPTPTPPCRIVREKRATFDQTPHNEVLRPECRTAAANLFLAGDWTATGLPATIEGAIRSGRRAAALALVP